VYNHLLPGILEENGYSSKAGPIILILCGGSDMTIDILQSYREKYADARRASLAG
jgi:hypothetical protein